MNIKIALGFSSRCRASLENRGDSVRVRSNVRIGARVCRHGEITVAGVPVRRALVARGFRGRSSLWVIFPKILCGAYWRTGNRRKSNSPRASERASERVASRHVMSRYVDVASSVVAWIRRVLVVSSRRRRLLTCIGLSFHARRSYMRTMRRDSMCPFTTRSENDVTAPVMTTRTTTYCQPSPSRSAALSSLIARNKEAVHLIGICAVKISHALSCSVCTVLGRNKKSWDLSSSSIYQREMFSVRSRVTVVEDYVYSKCGFSELQWESRGRGGRGDDFA